MSQRTCPDQGTCHHECGADQCFRVQCCGPLSGVFPGNRWPASCGDEIELGGIIACSLSTGHGGPHHRDGITWGT